MGTSLDGFPPRRGLSEKQRADAVRLALADGTAARLREAAGWHREELGRRVGVGPDVVAAWEEHRAAPSAAHAVLLWSVLLDACRTTGPPGPHR